MMSDYLRDDERRLRTCGDYLVVDGKVRITKKSLDTLLDRLSEARRVLASVEWRGVMTMSGVPTCIRCGYRKHAPDCALAAALEGVRR